MKQASWYAAAGGEYAIRVPEGWTAEPDPEEGGVEISHPDGAGVLHLVAFPYAGVPADPAEELYAFLEEQEIELHEDEIEEIALENGAELALCEYLEEDEDGGSAYWIVGVAALPDALVFAHYTCDAGDEDAERATIREVLRTLGRAPGAEA